MEQQEISNLNERQRAVLKRAANLGIVIQREFPEVAEDYRAGRLVPEIIAQYDVLSRYGVGRNVAIKAILFAIQGYNGGIGVNSYRGLIDSSELEELRDGIIQRAINNRISEAHLGVSESRSEEAQEHISTAASRIGRRDYELKRGLFALSKKQLSDCGKRGANKARKMGVGIYAMSAEQLRESRLKGGFASGYLTYQRGIGIHSLTTEERRANGCKTRDRKLGLYAMTREELQKCSRKAALARGEVLWSKEEIQEAFLLSQQEEYRFGSFADNEKIAKTINEKYHEGKPVRSASTVSSARKRYLKSLEAEIEKLGR